MSISRTRLWHRGAVVAAYVLLGIAAGHAVGADLCGNTPVLDLGTLPFNGVPLDTHTVGAGMSTQTVAVGRIVVPNPLPAGYPGGTTSAVVYEYASSPAWRKVSLSKNRCDFGTASPAFVQGASSASVNIKFGTPDTFAGMVQQVQFTAGDIWYVNVKNELMGGGPSCTGNNDCNFAIKLYPPSGGSTTPQLSCAATATPTSGTVSQPLSLAINCSNASGTIIHQWSASAGCAVPFGAATATVTETTLRTCTYTDTVSAGGAVTTAPVTVQWNAPAGPAAPVVTGAKGQLADVYSFTWPAVSGATSYSVQTSTDNGATWTPQNPQTGTSFKLYDASPLTGRLVLQAKACAAAACSNWSASDYSERLATGTVPTVAVTSSNASLMAGDTLALTVTVTGDSFAIDAGLPAYALGKVTVLDSVGGAMAGCAEVAVRPSNGVGVATCTTPALAQGSHTFTASYSGDSTRTQAGGATLVRQVAPVPAPTITFTPDSQFASYQLPVIYAGDSVAGTLTISGAKPGLTVNVVQNGGTPQTITQTGNTATISLRTSGAVVGTPYVVTVAANYTNYNTESGNSTITFGVLPRLPLLSLTPPTSAASGRSTLLSAKLGSPVATGLVYDPPSQGAWRLQLRRVGSTGETTPVGSPVTLGSDGTATLDAGDLAPGCVTFNVLATLTNAPFGLNASTKASSNVVVMVSDGSAIEIVPKASRVNGASPFFALIGVTTTKQARMADVGMVRHFVSEDGTQFVPLADNAGKEVAGTALLLTSQTLTGNVKRWYKASVANKWTGVVTESQPQTLQSFITPLVTVSAPKVTMPGHPVTLSASTSTAGVDAVFDWTLTVDGVVQTATGPSVTVTPNAVTPIRATVKGYDQHAPLTNTLASKSVNVVVAVLAPTLAAPVVIGPTIVESTKSYTFQAIQRSPFPPNSGTDLRIVSKWVLPDGSNSTDNPVTYVLKDGDASFVRYESMLEGYPNSVVRTDHALKPWTYQFPAMKIAATVVKRYVPATVMYAAGVADLSKLAGLHGETFSYAWTFPNGANVKAQKDGTATVEYANPGTYPVSVTVSDTRGNSVTVNAEPFAALPPLPVAFTLAVSNTDRFGRPGSVAVKPTVTSMPVGDSMAGFTYYVNGVEQGTGFAGVTIPIAEPGTYTVSAVGRTKLGVTGEGTAAPITLVAGDTPKCVPTKGGNGVTTLSFVSNCSVQRGSIVRYEWYPGGVRSNVTASFINFQSSQIATTQFVTVKAYTDKGQVGGATYDVQTGVITQF